MTDWNGSSVDFVHKGLSRFCRSHGGASISRVFQESAIRISDELIERSHYERAGSADEDQVSRLFVTVDYYQAAIVQIGPALSRLGSVHPDLPAAFYEVFARNLRRWMGVYDFVEAEQYAKDQIEMMDEEELKESFLPKVESARPPCLKDLPSDDLVSNPLTYEAALKQLKRLASKARRSKAETIIQRCLELDAFGNGHEHLWPARLVEQVPEMEEYLENTDSPGPGALIVFEENDAIEACFSEDLQYLGQDQPLMSTLMMVVHLDQHAPSLDAQVQSVFSYLAAMLRSLACAAELIETIRRIYDADARQRGMESGIQAH